MKQTIKTFDIFDTLVARLCIHPHEIFRAVETRSKFTGFTDLRIQAEQRIYHRKYIFDDIYNVMIAEGLISTTHAHVLKEFELEEEYKNLIPIALNCSLVSPIDILVSDIYLPIEFVKRVVEEKCHLNYNPIYISSHGKNSGHAWKSLNSHYNIVAHLGDNQHSDIVRAEEAGVAARLTVISNLTDTEQSISNLGLPFLAQLIRKIRLEFWDEDPEIYRIGLVELQINLPLLLAASAVLLKRAEKKGWKRVLFSSRDCFLWYKTFQFISAAFPKVLSSEYFYTSRVARAFPTPDYKNYFITKSPSNETVIVDICGTGWSLGRLFKSTDHQVDTFFLHFLENSPLLAAYSENFGKGLDSTFISFITRSGDNTLLEASNCAPHPMIETVQEIDNMFFPVYANLEQERSTVRLASRSNEIFLSGLAQLKELDATELLMIVSTFEDRHVDYFYSILTGQYDALSKIRSQQMSENGPVARLLDEKKRLSSP